MRALETFADIRDHQWEEERIRLFRLLGAIIDHEPARWGCFSIMLDAIELRVIAGVGLGWDHLSVSTNRPRMPTWTEMEHVKRLFFDDHETAMQLHVPPADHISIHPYVLHLWRPHDVDIPRPPAELV